MATSPCKETPYLLQQLMVMYSMYASISVVCRADQLRSILTCSCNRLSDCQTRASHCDPHIPLLHAILPSAAEARILAATIFAVIDTPSETLSESWHDQTTHIGVDIRSLDS